MKTFGQNVSVGATRLLGKIGDPDIVMLDCLVSLKIPDAELQGMNSQDNQVKNEICLKFFDSFIPSEKSESTYTFVTAKDMCEEYQASELNGDLKYKDKKIFVFGFVKRIGKHSSGLNSVILESYLENSINSVMLVYNKRIDLELSKLGPGKAIGALCIGDGMARGIPTLKHCVPREVELRKKSRPNQL
jgi:hypothetical protein